MVEEMPVQESNESQYDAWQAVKEETNRIKKQIEDTEDLAEKQNLEAQLAEAQRKEALCEVAYHEFQREQEHPASEENEEIAA